MTTKIVLVFDSQAAMGQTARPVQEEIDLYAENLNTEMQRTMQDLGYIGFRVEREER